MKSKVKNQKAHFKRRMLQRFDFRITDNDLAQIVNIIQKGRAILIEKQTCRVSVWRLKFRKKEMDIVYDRKRKMPVTVKYILNEEKAAA